MINIAESVISASSSRGETNIGKKGREKGTKAEFKNERKKKILKNLS